MFIFMYNIEFDVLIMVKKKKFHLFISLMDIIKLNKKPSNQIDSTVYINMTF